MTTSQYGSLAKRLLRALSAVLVAALPLLAPRPALAAADTPLDPGLVGSWHWETSAYIGGGDYSVLIKTTRDFTIEADGRCTYRTVQSTDGDIEKTPEVTEMTGRVVQRGDTLIATSDQGQTYRFRFRLEGDNGLYLNGVLYEKQ